MYDIVIQGGKIWTGYFYSQYLLSSVVWQVKNMLIGNTDVRMGEFVKVRYGIDLYDKKGTECPFCNAKSHGTPWLFNGDGGEEVFHCFRCGRSLGIYAFVCEIENCSFKEARKIINGDSFVDPEITEKLKKESRQSPSNMVKRYLGRKNMSQKQLQILKDDFKEVSTERLVEINSEIGYPLTLFPIKEIKIHLDNGEEVAVEWDEIFDEMNAEVRRERQDNIEAWEGLAYAERKFYDRMGI